MADRGVVARAGWALAVLSVPVWCASFLVAPFLPLDVPARAALGGGFIGVGELMFWLGAAMAGSEAVAWLRGGWRSPRGPSTPEEDDAGGSER
jgi:hypothetical protein